MGKLSPPRVVDYRTQASHPERREGGRRFRGLAPAGGRPVVSVVTIAFNPGAALERTMTSVLAQTYPWVEYIVVDGGSRDGSLDVLMRHDDDIAYWLSEPDKGIGDIFCKGGALATGEYLAIVNADDWLEPDQLAIAVAALESSGAGFVFGDLRCHCDNGDAFLMRGDPAFIDKMGKTVPALPTSTVVIRREICERFGLFRQKFRMSVDHEFLLRLVRNGVTGVYVPAICGNMSLGGVSDTRWKRGLAECRDVSISSGRNPVAAWFEFGLRVVKGNARRLMEKHASARLFNPHDRAGADGPAGDPKPQARLVETAPRHRFLDLIRADWVANSGNWKGRLLTLLYRVAHQCVYAPVWAKPFAYAYIAFYKVFTELLVCAEIPWRTPVGPGLRIFHAHGLVVSCDAVLGSNVVLRHGVTIGQSRMGVNDAPVVGDNVEFGASSVAIGKIRIGDGAIIGAGAIVTKDVPPGGVMVGNPARLLRIVEPSGSPPGQKPTGK